MTRLLNAPPFHHRSHLNILKVFVIYANLVSLSLYALLHIIFYDLEFVFVEELIIALKIMGWATGTAIVLSFILFATDGLRYLIRHRKQFKFPGILHIGARRPIKNSGA